MSYCLTCVRNLTKFSVTFHRNLGILTKISSRLTKKINSFPSIYSETQNDKIYDVRLSLVKSYGKSIKGKKGSTVIKVDERELGLVYDVDDLYQEFKTPIDNMKKQFIEQLNLRTNMDAIENLKVKYDGQTCTIRELAEVGRKSPKDVILNMSCFPDATPYVMEALKKSALGLNPCQNGTTISIPIPKVTKDYRETLAKKARELYNGCRTSIRKVQNKNILKLEDVSDLSSDDSFRLKSQLTALADKYIAEAEEMLKVKEKELLATE